MKQALCIARDAINVKVKVKTKRRERARMCCQVVPSKSFKVQQEWQVGC